VKRALLALLLCACAPEGAEGGPCEVEVGPPGGPTLVRSCDPGLRCHGVNQPGTCVQDACAVDGDCTADFVCTELEGDDRCNPPDCISSSDCVDGSRCEDEACVRLPP
jgi:hypothetical protein